MNLLNNFRRIINFIVHHRKEVLSGEFWLTIIRVVKERFNYLQRVSNAEFLQNLKEIQRRPWNLRLELTNICNSNCIFCAYQLQTRPKTVMKDTIYLKALNDYCSIGGGELLFESCVGDPSCDPNLIERIKTAHSLPEIKRIAIITNGVNFENLGIESLLCSGITDISISTGLWNERLYQLIYRNKSYQRMKQNVTNLLKMNTEFGNPVRIKICFRSNLSMRKTLQSPDYQAIRKYTHRIEFNTDFDTWLGNIGQKDLIAGMHIRPFAKIENEPCYWLYDGPIVFANGKVGLCGCRDFNAQSELVIGDITESSLLDLWQLEVTHNLRYRFSQGDFPDICRKCTSYANLDLYRSRRGSLRAGLVKDWFKEASENLEYVKQ